MKLSQVLVKTFHLSKQIERLQTKYQEGIDKIQSCFDDKNLSEFSVRIDSENSFPSILTAKKSERMYINYSVTNLKKLLPKPLLKLVLRRTGLIDDIQGFVSLMKEYNVPKDAWKGLVHIVCDVDKKEMEQQYAIGSINLQELKDNNCFTVKISKSIRFQLKHELNKGDSD